VLQVSNIEEIEQQVARLLQTIITAFEGRDFCVSVFPQVEQRHWLIDVGKQTTIRQHSLSATSVPKISEIG